jgi:hypothetical protein
MQAFPSQFVALRIGISNNSDRALNYRFFIPFKRHNSSLWPAAHSSSTYNRAWLPGTELPIYTRLYTSPSLVRLQKVNVLVKIVMSVGTHNRAWIPGSPGRGSELPG